MATQLYTVTASIKKGLPRGWRNVHQSHIFAEDKAAARQ